MKRTYQPKKRQRNKVHGFRVRMKTQGGRNTIKRRRKQGQKARFRLTLHEVPADQESKGLYENPAGWEKGTRGEPDDRLDALRQDALCGVCR